MAQSTVHLKGKAEDISYETDLVWGDGECCDFFNQNMHVF